MGTHKRHIYSVKTAYMLGKGCDLDNFHQAWVDLWSFDASPKIRHFLSRLCTNSLPTRSLLKHRHLLDDDSCPWRCGAVETTGHTIFDFPRFNELWIDCGCDAMKDFAAFPSMSDVLFHWRGIDKEVRIKGMYLAWCIWGERNQKVFHNKNTPISFSWLVFLDWLKSKVNMPNASILPPSLTVPQAYAFGSPPYWYCQNNYSCMFRY